MGRLPFIIATFLVVITGRTISPMILEMLVAVGFLAPQQSTNAIVEPIPEATWKCPECSESEKYVLAELQQHTKITDRNALATIMGNIKQESNFHSNIWGGLEFLTTLVIGWVWHHSVDLSSKV